MKPERNRESKKESTSRSTAKSLSGKGALGKLTELGAASSEQPNKSLEVFPNPQPKRDFVIHMQIPEFTCLCPKTGQPDFATLYLDYIPDKRCVELKSLKLYINSFRSVKIFHEHVINIILEDFVSACDPLSIELEGPARADSRSRSRRARTRR